MLIRDILEEQMRTRPEHIALRAGDAVLSYARLVARVTGLATGLRALGLLPGERVAVLLPNTLELVITLLAVNVAGLIAVPLSAGYPPILLREIVSNTAARALVTAPDLLPSLPLQAFDPPSRTILTGEQVPGSLSFEALCRTVPFDGALPAPPEEDPIGLIVYTSGSTGRPKGVAHTQRRLVRRADLLIQALSLTADDRTLSALHLGRPLFFVGNLLTMLRVGGCLALVEPIATDPFWALYQEIGPAYCIIPPGLASQLLDSPAAARADHRRLRAWIQVGDRASETLQARVTTLTGRPPRAMFGLTETGYLTITAAAGRHKPDSIGAPLPGVEMRLLDQDGRPVAPGQVGRLTVRTPNMMVGYWNDTLLTHRAMGSGWLDTGDLLQVDEDGDYRFVGRASDTIVVQDGAKVAVARLVEVLRTHPQIDEAEVVGVPDGVDGQVPIAFYRLQDAAADPGEGALRAWIADQIDAWSVPVHLYPLDRWPLTANGKVDRRCLIDWAQDRMRTRATG